MESWFIILDVNEDETLINVRKKYKQLALQFHPDKNNGDYSKFKEIQNAYDYRMYQPENLFGDDNINSQSFILRETKEALEILQFLFNTRRLNQEITVDLLKKLVIRYKMAPFKMNKKNYIDVLFVRISKEKIQRCLKYLELIM